MNHNEQQWIIAIHREAKTTRQAVVFLAWLFGILTALGIGVAIYTIVTVANAVNSITYP